MKERKKDNEEKKIWEEEKHKQAYAMPLPTMHHATSGDLGALDKLISLQLHSCFNLVSVCVHVCSQNSTFSRHLMRSDINLVILCVIIIQDACVPILVDFYLLFSSFLPPTHFANLKHLSSNFIPPWERAWARARWVVVVVGWLHALGEKPSV